jgi:hypothetical protein
MLAFADCLCSFSFAMPLIELLTASRDRFKPALTDEELESAKQIAAANDGLPDEEISLLINDSLGLQERHDKWRSFDQNVDGFNKDLADLVNKWGVCPLVPPPVAVAFITQCLIGASILFASLTEQAMEG